MLSPTPTRQERKGYKRGCLGEGGQDCPLSCSPLPSPLPFLLLSSILISSFLSSPSLPSLPSSHLPSLSVSSSSFSSRPLLSSSPALALSLPFLSQHITGSTTFSALRRPTCGPTWGVQTLQVQNPEMQTPSGPPHHPPAEGQCLLVGQSELKTRLMNKEVAAGRAQPIRGLSSTPRPFSSPKLSASPVLLRGGPPKGCFTTNCTQTPALPAAAWMKYQKR